MKQVEYSVEDLQARVLAGLCFALGGLAGGLALFNVIAHRDEILIILECLFCLISFFLFLKATNKRYLEWHKSVYLAFMLFIIFYASYIFPINNGLLFWTFCLPTVFYLLLGNERGFTFTLIAFIGEAGILYLKTLDTHSFSLVGAPVNFTFCYLAIWVVSHVYESNRAVTEASLYRLAHTDNLTGALNRLAFQQTTSLLIEKRTHFFLLLIDVDYFKKINDQYGHETGDDVLKQFVQTMSEFVGYENVFRYGGEEFCVIDRRSKNFRDSARFAEELRSIIEQRIIVTGHRTLNITASFGVAEATLGVSLDALISQADLRMYRAKAAGRNKVVSDDYSPQIRK